ncbi:MAG: S41 family peptidase [Dehalococcoidia bacterium]
MDIPQTSPGPTSAETTARWAIVVLLLLALVSLAFGLGFGVSELGDDGSSAPAASPDDASGDLSGDDLLGASILDEIYDILSTSHINKEVLDPDTFRQAAIAGVLSTLNDRETQFLTAEQLAQGSLDLSSVYEGIGASVTDRNGVLEIVSPFRDSPAEEAGLRAGDIILAVDGERTDGWSDSEGVLKIRGAQGTPVTLSVQHTDGTTEDIIIVRGEIPIETVYIEPRLEVIPGESGTTLVDSTGALVTDIGYVNITDFRERTAIELREKLAEVEDQGYVGLILDLRSNPGGRLDTTIEATDEFLQSGRILSQVDSDDQEEVWSAEPGGSATNIPIVILQDAGSASGAEVMAAALRDNGRATIVGTRSYGKGTVNQLRELTSCGVPGQCGALYISIGEWLTPNGERIEGIGIDPDVEVELTEEQYIAGGDLQLFKAIEILRGGS